MDKYKIAVQIASCFGIGHLPKAPGTWASLYTAAIAYLLQVYIGTSALFVFFTAACLLSIWSADIILKNNPDDPDPSWIVIDEVAGQSFVFFYLFLSNVGFAAVAFLLFRAFDIFKPWPISWVDKKFPNTFGVLADDVLAGIISGFLLFLFQVI